MSTQATVAVEAARKVLYNKVASQVDAFDARVATLRAKAESAGADAELAAIAKLVTASQTLDHKAAALKSASETTFRRVQDDIERHLGQFDTSLRAIASRVKAR